VGSVKRGGSSKRTQGKGEYAQSSEILPKRANLVKGELGGMKVNMGGWEKEWQLWSRYETIGPTGGQKR